MSTRTRWWTKKSVSRTSGTWPHHVRMGESVVNDATDVSSRRGNAKFIGANRWARLKTH